MIDPAAPVREDVALAILHAPPDARPALTALFALDARLAQVVRTTATPVVGQMRFAWWRDALVRLDTAPAPAEPVLAALAADVIPRGVTGETLAGLVDSWEELVVAEDAIDLDAHARRGKMLFGAAAHMLGTAVPEAAGAGWALADLSGHLSDAEQAGAARGLAMQRLAAAFADRWPPAGRPIGLLALLAQFDLDTVGPARRAMRSMRFKLMGR